MEATTVLAFVNGMVMVGFILLLAKQSRQHDRDIEQLKEDFRAERRLKENARTLLMQETARATVLENKLNELKTIGTQEFPK